MNNYLFALDIGTRSVVGVLLKKNIENQEQYDFIDMVCIEHKERAMLNGQIHNAPLVSHVISEVRKLLEQRNQVTLSKTSVAAAGRALLTRKEYCEEIFTEERIITKQDVTKLTLSCVHKAQSQVKKEQSAQNTTNYYCVGYSLVRNYLDDVELGNLEGQRGNKISVEIVAAFLPKMVLESLKYVIEDNNLIMANLTLEPIAAINAIIPSTMRKLNLVLVDIGAGTSDIAISSEGVIHAYGMVPMAGDEITEKLSSDLLLDFNEADRVKRIIMDAEQTEYQDVLGLTHQSDKKSLIALIDPASEQLASEIVKNILSLNGRIPQAVLLIGGGSLTPLLSQKIASFLELPESRVAVQKAKSIPGLIGLPEEYSGSEFITPLAIALTDKHKSALDFIDVYVNDLKVSVLNLGENTVFDALLNAGISLEKIYGKAGTSKTVKVNGKVHLVPGSPGKSSAIYIDDKEVQMDNPITSQDRIYFVSGETGDDGKALLAEFIPSPQYIIFNGQKIQIPLEVMVDNRITDDYHIELRDNANVSVRELHTVAEFLEKSNKEYLHSINFTLGINQKSTHKSMNLYEYFINDQPASLDSVIKNGDRLNISQKDESSFTISNIMGNILNSLEKKIMTVYLNGDKIEIPISDLEVHHNDKKADVQSVIRNNDIIYVKKTELKKPLLIDLFKEIHYTPKAPEGKTKVDILLNDKEAEYTSPISEGDQIRIIWR